MTSEPQDHVPPRPDAPRADFSTPVFGAGAPSGPLQPMDPAPPSGPQAAPVFRESAYYVNLSGYEDGPYRFGQVEEMLRAGRLKPHHEISRDGGPWVPAGDVPGLYSDKSWLAALLLSVFLGVFGVDRFYLGHIGLGLAKLFLSWMTGGIWPLIDIILIAMNKVQDSDGRPLRPMD